MRAFLTRLNDPRGGAGNEYAGHQDTVQSRCRKSEEIGERERRQTYAGKPEGGPNSISDAVANSLACRTSRVQSRLKIGVKW